AVKRGVKVRVLLDHWASSHTRDYKATLKRLTDMGAEWHLMLPVQPLKGNNQRLDLRNHRKILVVDGNTAFVGSQNVIDH
ncbi:phospholipase D-like domain-containing protein, partial [Rhizobium johnstonii]|uniref:phospholipase D-like domain-containing protein n=1 Tax=Rhizobium johnstonii TaxID=3019933 RepID=UPI003F9597AC